MLIMTSMMLDACATPTVEDVLEQVTEEPAAGPAEGEAAEEAEAPEEVTEEATEEPTPEPTPEPMPTPTEEVVAVEELLDAAYADFLAGMEAYNTITPEDVNAALAEGTELFLLDVRQPEELEENGYIEGAINIPLRELGKNIDKLPAFDTPMVTYCGSGWRCTMAMTALGALGYTNVKTMVGSSFGGWMEAGYPVVQGMLPEPEALNAVEPDPALLAAIDEALSNIPEGWGVITAEDLNAALAEGAELVLLDVRRPDEVEAEGYIEGAVQVPLEQMIELRDEWPAIEADIVVYCAAGARGNIAATILRTYGYQSVRNLKGGFGAWVEAGYPVVSE